MNTQTKRTDMKNKLQKYKDASSMIVWGCVMWATTEILARVTNWSWEVIAAFFAGSYMMLLVLTLIGGWRMRMMERERQAAMDQFVKDQKADQERQAKIDKEIIRQLRNEHELSGTEQDRRLRALEAALKHLRGK